MAILDFPNTYTDITQEEKDLLINSPEHHKVQICLSEFKEAIMSSDKFQQMCKVPSQHWIQSLRTYFNTDRTANLMKLHDEELSAYDDEVLKGPDLSHSTPWKELTLCFDNTRQDGSDNLPEQKDYYFGGLSLHAISMLALDLIEACRAIGVSSISTDDL